MYYRERVLEGKYDRVEHLARIETVIVQRSRTMIRGYKPNAHSSALPPEGTRDPLIYICPCGVT
jgi:hypothetical protein|nr:hypothetical protein Q903MT_gene6074 [Picea sitchensis]